MIAEECHVSDQRAHFKTDKIGIFLLNDSITEDRRKSPTFSVRYFYFKKVKNANQMLKKYFASGITSIHIELTTVPHLQKCDKVSYPD